MSAKPAQPVTVNELLTCLLKSDVTFLHFSSIPPQYRFSILQSINSYEFCILNVVYLPSEATRLKTSITFVARTMETHAPSIVLKTRKCP